MDQKIPYKPYLLYLRPVSANSSATTIGWGAQNVTWEVESRSDENTGAVPMTGSFKSWSRFGWDYGNYGNSSVIPTSIKVKFFIKY